MKFAAFFLLTTCAIFSTASLYAATFQGLGDLPGGTFNSAASAVSADGSVVVGASYSSNGLEAFRWSSSTGMVGIGDFPGGGFSSVAYGVSADGTVIVGTGEGGEYPGNEIPFRWTAAGMVSIGDTTGGATPGFAYGVSADGSVVVGRDRNVNDVAFRWTSVSGSIGLTQFPGGISPFDGLATSADGSTVVGLGFSANGTEAFLWSKATLTNIGLGDLPGGIFYSKATAVSADGSVVAGESRSTSGVQAFRWTQSGGMVGIGDLAGGTFSSTATGISADGSIIVGQGTGANGLEAIRWDAEHKVQSVGALLTAEGVDLTGWTLTYAAAISADGTAIVGYGTHNGMPEAWLARFPKPKPVVTVTGKRKLTTRKPKLTLKGTATDAERVEYKAGKGGFKPAKGSSSAWKIPLRLKSPLTVVSVRAVGPGGTSSPLKFRIRWK